ncbi:uncharacterized protein IL334_003873 [Kwoniella shivajii]|uniref:Clampless protein 1 n=1 Tax=Kwoniella shivajii TaxID=564305 RepID=A0ABZ1CYS7_9TREE|nr:hypothetical protein IL334_003873 [Kwoniella shivajii]
MTTYLSAAPQQQHPHRQLRTFSNKENSPSPSVFELTDIDAISTSLQTSLSGVTSSLRSKKSSAPGLGIGRAPKFTYRKHSSKPYGRVSSIQRAKKHLNRTTSSSSTTTTNNNTKSKPPKRGLKSRPKPIPSHLQIQQNPLKPHDEDKKLSVMDRVRLDRWRKSIWRPNVQILNQTQDQGHNQDQQHQCQPQVRVPLMLPYPRFPPVSNIDNDDLRDIPIQYILDRLTPMLPSISTITLAYRPYATIQHPDPTIQAGSTLALAIPEIIDGSKPHWRQKARGREPDMVLGVMKKGAESENGKMVIPVMSTVFASQCAYWPRLTTPPSASSSSTPSSSFTAPSVAPTQTQSEAAVSAILPAILETSECVTSCESDKSWSSDSESDSDNDNDNERPQIPSPKIDDQGFLHLPIIPLPLPSPETFNLIHRHLHHPNRPLIPDLLSLPDTCTSRKNIVDALSELTVQQLMSKLEILQGVWQNLCCLGIGRLGTWKQLGEAWACTVGIIAGNGMLLRGTEDQSKDGNGHRSKVRTAAEEVAWEWVKRERIKEGQ